MDQPRRLYIPVLLGTVRKERRSAAAARLLLEEVLKFPDVETELIDIAQLSLPTDDAGEAIKDPGYAEKMNRCDGLIIVSPEYNHGYPGMLKHVLDSCLKEYVHKAAGVVGVSAGPWGGTRMIENLLPVLRELGLVTIFWDVNITHAARLFNAAGELQDPAYLSRIEKFLRELIWMAKTLRYGRENIK